ncbi:MAG TPA: hypothetical protein VF719_01535, partial [Abditibacteriaceae bacterium]
MKKKFASKLTAAPFVSTRSVALPGMLLVGMSALVTTTHPVLVTNAFAQGQAILPQGTFEQPGINGRPADWGINTPEGTTLAGDAGNHWVQLRDGAVMQHHLKLSPEWTKLTVSARFKLSDYQKGPEGWHGPRISLRFVDDKNQMVGDYPAQPQIAGNTDWVTKEVSTDIPKGATQLLIEPGLWGSKGLLEIDDIIVKASPEATAATAATAAQLVAPVDAALPADKTKTGTKTGTKIGSWGVSFADGWSSFGWSANPEKGTNGIRSWSGTDTTFPGQFGSFSSTWTPG